MGDFLQILSWPELVGADSWRHGPWARAYVFFLFFLVPSARRCLNKKPEHILKQDINIRYEHNIFKHQTIKHRCSNLLIGARYYEVELVSEALRTPKELMLLLLWFFVGFAYDLLGQPGGSCYAKQKPAHKRMTNTNI